MASNLDWNSIKEIRILPRHGCFYTEFVYEMKTQSVKLDQDKAISIDHGLDNWLTCVDTQGHSFIVARPGKFSGSDVALAERQRIDGKHLKSKNQWYNKQIATLKENKPQGFWSKILARITEKRDCFAGSQPDTGCGQQNSAINYQLLP